MALVFADRVKVRARTAGTGTFTLENTVEGFQSFSVIGDGNETYYGIVDVAGNWEIGRGTYTSSGTTLSRDQVVSSSNNDSLVNFPAGSKNVYTTIPSALVGTILGTEIIQVDLKGSVFADDSSILVDATDGVLRGILIGNVTGNVSGSAGSATVAGTVDITNTNGLTTLYYPTFTEDRTAGQILRGDIDLTYRTDTNTLTAVNFAGNVTGNVTGDIKGSVFADNSTMIIDGTDGSILYDPGTPSDWSGTPPESLKEAVDRLAAVVKILNGGTGA